MTRKTSPVRWVRAVLAAACALASLILPASAALVPASVSTTGESVSTVVLDDQSTVVKFLADGTFTVPAGATARILVVGGGGGGGGDCAPGGGGGGVIDRDSVMLSPGTYTVAVGVGGTGGSGTGVKGTNGGNTSLTRNGADGPLALAYGGGGAGAWNNGAGLDGGCGGGGWGNPGQGVAGQGYPATAQQGDSPGGGGGAGGSPVAVNIGRGNSTQRQADGGPGRASDITGTTEYYGPGGGSGGFNGLAGWGGDQSTLATEGWIWGCGWSHSSAMTDAAMVEAGLKQQGRDGYGGGGGGSSNTHYAGGNGGSGVLIVRLAPVTTGPEPKVVIADTEDGDRSAVIHAYLASVGDGAATATVSYKFATSLSGLETAEAVVAAADAAAGTLVPISLTGLPGGKPVYVRLFAENDLGVAATPVDATVHPLLAFSPALFELFAEFTVEGYQGSEELADFPVLVRLSEGSPVGFTYADCAADGSDIRFADAGGNLIPHEFETWNPAGESLAWVRLPAVTDGTTFRMYYCTETPGVPSSEDVWSRYVAVLHGGDAIANAVAGGVAATAGSGSVAASAEAGIVGGGIRKSAYKAIGVNVAAPASKLTDNGKFSVSGWFKRNGNGGAGGGNGTHVLSASRAGWNNGTGYLWLQEGTKYISVAANNSHQFSDSPNGYKLADLTWAHVAFAYDYGASLTTWFDGAQDNRKTSGIGDLRSSGVWTFGSYQNVASDDSFRGDMDELRILDGVATGDWIQAEHDTVADADFLAKGAVQVLNPDAPRIAAPTIVEGILRLDVSLACSVDGATVRYRVAASGEDVDAAAPVVLTTSSTADEVLSFSLTGLVGDETYTIVFEAEKDGAAARPITRTASPFAATAAFTPSVAGNDALTRAGGDEVHVLSASGTFTLATRRRARLLAVGGGGGAGWGSTSGGAGGGAGGMLEISDVLLQPGTYRYEVGAGGAPGKADAEKGGNGGDTVLYWVDPATGVETEVAHAYGGGGSGCYQWGNYAGKAGGSGGGGMYRENNQYGAGGAGTEGQGNAGGGWTSNPGVTVGASGGGGAGEAGEVGTTAKGGNGGDGRMSDITGAEVWYAGGGAGARRRNDGSVTTPGKGGKGGGGDGANYGWYTGDARLDGADGLGGGGGGGLAWYHNGSGSQWYNCFGGRGGAGTLVVRFAADAAATPSLASAEAALTDRTEATFSGAVAWEGDGATGADLVLTLDGVSETVATGLKQGDAFSFEKTVARGATVAWSIKLVNSLGAESAAVAGSLAVPADDPVAITTSGETETRTVGTDTVAIFNNTAAAGSFTVPAGGAWVEMLVVGGGGAGGRAWDNNFSAAGGGAGGFVYKPALFLEAGTYSVTVGAGGAGREGGVKADTGRPGRSGGSSYVTLGGTDVVRAYGGSGGAGRYAGNLTNDTASVGFPMGSTGGAGQGIDQNLSFPVEAQLPTDPAQGNPGGASRRADVTNGSGSGTYWFPGGGGGAGAPGGDGDPVALLSGRGGDGLPCSITGEEVWYAGGGGAGSGYGAPGSISYPAAAGGKGGGGYGQRWKTESDADNKGTDGLGGGGGGGGGYNGNNDNVTASIAGHSGGSGTVIIRWRSLPLGTIELTPDEPVPGFRRATFSGVVDAVGGDGETVDVEIGLATVGSATTNWTAAASGLAVGDAFSVAVDGLADGTTYLASWRATNRAGASATGEAGTVLTVAGAYLVPGADATGATITQVGQDSIYTYSNPATAGTFTVSRAGYARVLLAGGGGAGGYYRGGGGGGGGVIEEDLVWLEAGTYAITVGPGGAPSNGSGARGGNGGDSVVSLGGVELWRAYGGGGGGSWSDNQANCSGGSGGSGGGGTYRSARFAGKALDPAQGHDGAPGLSYQNSWDWWSAGGGGGAGSAGLQASADHTEAGAGGAGRVSDISGSPEQYGAGGGAACTHLDSNASGAGGDGIGGHGRRNTITTYWVGDEAGRAGYGGGGGGGAERDWNSNFIRPGAAGGSGTVIIRFTGSAPAGLADAAVVAAAPSATDPTGADVQILVRSLGGAASATLELAYGASQGSLPLRHAVGTVSEAGTVDALLPGLEPGKTYYVAAAISTPAGETVTRAVEVTIPPAGAIGGGEAGLWQAIWIRSATDRDPDIWDGVSTKDVVAGTIAAIGTGDAVDPFTGTAYPWGGLHTMFLYKGYIFLKGGTTYTFGSRMDDSVYLRIGDTALLDTQADPSHSAFADFTAPWTGWYPLDVRLGNDVGAAHGPDGDGTTSWTGFALAFNTAGNRAMIPESAWTTLIDPGDGSLLRPEDPGLRYADTDVSATAGGSLTLAASVAPGIEPVHAYLCSGPAWGGNAPADWATAADLGEVAASDAATALDPATVAGWGSAAKVAAVALVHPDGTVTWSAPATYAGTSLLDLSAAATDWSQGDELTVSFTVAGGTAPYAVQLLVGNGPGNLVRVARTTLAAAGTGTLTATGLTPGSTYYWQIVATDAAGGSASSDPNANVLMPGAAVYLNERNGISWSVDQRTATFNGSLKALGAGDNWAQLFLTDHLYDRWPDNLRNFRGNTTNSNLRVQLTETGAFSITHTFDWGDEIGFNWVVSNSNGRLSWTTARMPDWNGNDAADVAHFWLGDYQTYTWKGGAGVWNDPAMWTPDGTMEGHEQAGYPVTGSIAAFPEGTSEVTIPAGRILKPVSLEALAGADVTIKATAESGEFGLLRTDAPSRQRNIYVRENASLVFSGVKGRWIPRTSNDTTLDIVGKNAYVEFTDGCDIDLGWGTGTYGIADWSNKRQGRGLRFTKGSKVYIRGCLMLAGPNEYVIDDSQVTMHPNGGRDESRVELAIWTGGRFVFRGAHPLLQANNRFAATTGNNPDAADETFVDFEIPAGGFAEAPLRSRAGNTYKLGNQGNASNKVIFRVPTNSPAATAAGILDQPIIWWPAGKETWMVLDNQYLPNPDTDYWYETTDDLTGAFSGWGVHIVGRPAVEEPQVVGLAVTNVVAGAADLFFYGIPGTNAASATFTAAIERLDDPSDTTAAVQLSGGNAGAVTAGTRFTLAATGLAEGGSYRITVSGVDGTDATLTCTETIDFDALADYAAASTTSAGATTAQDGAYTVWTFTDTENEGEFVVTRAGTARILVVGGGGSGGGGDTADTNTSNPRRGGGGGGGGEVVDTTLYLQPGTYRVVVGAGGARVTRQTLGKTGGHSSFDYRVTALGGGGGGGNWNNNGTWDRKGANGANGGGAAGQGSAGGAATATGGHAGGSSTYNAWANWNDVYAGAGGGSMAATGGDAGLDAQNMIAAGDGADGVPSDITGRTVYYGAGGGGGGAGLNFGPGRGGLGGKGGGGEGRAFWFTAPFAVSAADAAPGTGSGGGGGAAGGHNSNVPTEQQCYWGGAGGSGVVVVRMRTVSARTADPQVAVESVEPSAGGVSLALDVQSLGEGAAAADLAFAWDKAADYDAAKGYSHTNALGSVSATGAAAYTVAGLRPGTDYVGAVVASNTEGGAAEVAAGAFRTAGELHADAESGVVAGSWTIDAWTENDSGVFVDNLLRAANGTIVNFQQNRRKNGTWGVSASNQGGASEDLIDGVVNRTNGRYWGTGTNSLVVFTLPEKAAVSALRFYAGWGVGNEWSPISIEGIDVRSGANEPWAELPGSAIWAEKTTTWGTVAEFAAGGNDWLARDVRQIRVRFNRNSQRDGTMYWEIEADGAAESDAPALHARAGVGRALAVSSSIRTASALSVVATAAAGAPAFTDVIAVWGPAYAGEDAADWAHSRSVGTAAAGVATSIPATLDAADLADAVYVRFCGVGEDGTVSWSDSVYVPDLEVQADVPPVVVFGACTGSTGADATLTASLVSAGSLAQTQAADVTLQYTLDPDGFAGGVAASTVDTFAFAEDAAVGAIPAVAVKPLRPNRRYYARFVATNDGGQTGTSDVFTFETSDGGQGEITVEGGLLQQRVTGVSNAGNIAGTRTMVWDETKAELVEGVIMSETTGSATSEKNGTTYAWPENGGFIYKGYVFLEGGVEYTLGSGIDDTCEVTIDGAVVLTQANYAAAGVFAKVTKATTGWYPIQIIMSNGTGGAGRVGDLGLGWNTTGVQKRDKANMATFVDPGDGSLLRPTATRTIAIAGATPGANSVALDVAATSGKPVGACWAVWGAEDLGTASAVADWTGSQLLQASLDGSAATMSATLPIDAAATPVVRVAIVPASGDVMWSAPVLLSVADPVIGPASAATDGDRMTVSGTMQSVGTGADLALSLLWGYREDLSDARTAAVSIDAAGAYSATVTTLAGTNGWWRLVARDAAGGCDATLPVAFETAAGSVLKPIASATVSHHTITASGTLNVYGAGVTTATIWAGDDPDSLAPVAGSDKVLTGTGPFDIVGTIPGAPRAVYWKIVTENVAPGNSTWTSETPVYTITTEDAATYTWKPEVTEGDWNDPANWTVSGVADTTDVLGYPNNAKAKVVFLKDTAATVHVPAGTWTFATMDLNKTTLDLAFLGEGGGSTTLYGNVWGADNNSAWNGWRVVFDALTVREENTISLGGSRSQDVTMRLQNGAVLSVSGYQENRGTNVWLEAVGGSAIQWRNGDGDNAGLTLWVADGGLLLEDSTANPPDLNYMRGNGSVNGGARPGDQAVVLKGESVFRIRRYGRPYSESEDPGFGGALTLSFHVPLAGWNDLDEDAPIYADYLRNNADNKKFAWRSAGKEVPVVLEVAKDSPLLKSGRRRTVQLLEWNAGIDVKNVTLTDRKGVHMYYTYGFPQQTRKTPNSADEIPTGVAADIVGQGGTLLLIH